MRAAVADRATTSVRTSPSALEAARGRRDAGRSQRSIGAMAVKASGLMTIETIATATTMLIASGGRTPRSRPSVTRMNENSPICASATRHGQRRAQRDSCSTRSTTTATSGLPTSTMARAAPATSPARRAARRVEQHADRDEEQHGEGVAHRQRLGRGAQAVVGAADDHAGEERAERHRHAEHQRRADGDAERDHQHGQREQLARAGGGHAIEHGAGSAAVPTTPVNATSAATFNSVDAERPPQSRAGVDGRRPAPAAAPARSR